MPVTGGGGFGSCIVSVESLIGISGTVFVRAIGPGAKVRS